MQSGTKGDLLFHAGDVCRYANRSSRRLPVTLPDFSQRYNGSTVPVKFFYVESFRSSGIITREQTDGRVEEKKRLNRGCAVRKRVKI
jgi:hypothetical protein